MKKKEWVKSDIAFNIFKIFFQEFKRFKALTNS